MFKVIGVTYVRTWFNDMQLFQYSSFVHTIFLFFPLYHSYILLSFSFSLSFLFFFIFFSFNFISLVYFFTNFPVDLFCYSNLSIDLYISLLGVSPRFYDETGERITMMVMEVMMRVMVAIMIMITITIMMMMIKKRMTIYSMNYCLIWCEELYDSMH